MSWRALAWAAKCHVRHAADKLVLLGLAERHNDETSTSYPSIDWLSEFGSLNRKTVITSLGRLEAAKLISDSGERRGRTLQIKAYALHFERVPKAEQFLKRNSPVFTPKESQKRDTEPSKEPFTPVISNEMTAPVAAEQPSELKPEHVLEAWNQLACRAGLPKAKMTDERRKKLRTFIRRHPVDDITEAISAIERSPFLRGENDRAWRADFNWMLEPRNFTKLTEGTYDR